MAENAIVTLIEAIETRLINLGYTATEEWFDFDSVPSSVIHQSFRIEARPEDVIYHSGNLSNPIEQIEIWLAFWKKRVTRTNIKTMLTSYREDVETNLLLINTQGLASDPLLTLKEAEFGKDKGNFLILRLMFQANYLRDVS